MEMEAPYLQAIQVIDGTTRGEKQMTLNIIARRIAHAKSSDAHSVNSETLISSVPQLLRPLVLVEVANILHQYEGIVDALKSEDMNVVSRALKARWFFDGCDTSLVNVQYLIETVFPEISLFARSEIVKKFGIYLKNSAFAMNFFNSLAQQYGVSQALPLLSACDEDFIVKVVIENQINLPLKIMKMLYRKYPRSVTEYLLYKPEDRNIRDRYQINICDYKDFLPEIAIKHLEDFMEICMIHNCSDIKLAKRAANMFIEKHSDLLVESPAQYLQFVSLKTVTRKLPVDKFTEMFKNLFPAEKGDFNYGTLNKYLEYYKPEQDRIPLILNTFRELYGKDLLRCKDLVNSDLMKVLPPADRVKQARLKLEDDKDWHIHNPELSWRCYLPCSESIPAIIKEITKSSKVWKRGDLMEQLVHTARINDDKDNLLKVLNYIYDRHRNDECWIFHRSLNVICNSFELGTLSSTHWEILKKYIKVAEMRDDFDGKEDTLSPVIASALHYNVLNGLPLDDYLIKFVDLNMSLDFYNWNILTKYPNLEKKFLVRFIEVLSNRYFVDYEISSSKVIDVICSLALAIQEFNSRHRVFDGKLNDMSIKNYPWLVEKIKACILGENHKTDYGRKRLLELIRANEQDLYNLWIRDIGEFWTFGVDVISDVLRRQPQRVLDNWKECMEEVQSTVHSAQKSSLFIRKIQWYQELPIKFFNESLKIYNNQPEKCIAAMSTLALLTDGETYTKIINPYIPNSEKFDIDNPNAKDIHSMLLAIAANLRKVNPPVSLDVIARFCVGDYLRMAMRSLVSVSRRVPIAKVIPFAKMLTDRRVSVMKHGIRLMCLVAPLEEVRTFLTDLWNTQGHTSIREVVFTKIYDFFYEQPDSNSWLMMQTCLNNLGTNDDETIFDRLTNLSTVLNKYIYEYIKTVLNVLESMEKTGEDPKKYITISCKLINNIDGRITQILPAEYCQDLVKKYMFVFDYNSAIFQTGLNFTIKSYLLASGKYKKLRFEFFREFFRDSVKKYWGKSHPKSSKFYPMNFMANQFFDNLVFHHDQWHDVRFSESLLHIFQSALQPHQDAISYMELVFLIDYHKSVTMADFATIIAKKMPELIGVFSPDCTSLISRRLSIFVTCRFGESESGEEILIDIIEVFVNSGSIHCALIAANMLFSISSKSKKLNERYKTVVHILTNLNHFGVSSILNERLATLDFCTDQDD